MPSSVRKCCESASLLRIEPPAPSGAFMRLRLLFRDFRFNLRRSFLVRLAPSSPTCAPPDDDSDAESVEDCILRPGTEVSGKAKPGLRAASRSMKLRLGITSASRMGSPRFAATGLSTRTRSAIAGRAIVPQSTRAATGARASSKIRLARRPRPPRLHHPRFTRRTLCARRVAALDTRLACHRL